MHQAVTEALSLIVGVLVSVLCDPFWDDINDGILDIYAINVNLGAMALCTGVPLTAQVH